MLVSQALEVLSTGDLSFEALDIGDGFLLGARNLLAVPEVDGVARAGVRLEDVQAADLTFRYGARYLTFCLDSLVFHILVSCFRFALPILGRAFVLFFSALGLSFIVFGLLAVPVLYCESLIFAFVHANLLSWSSFLEIVFACTGLGVSEHLH